MNLYLKLCRLFFILILSTYSAYGQEVFNNGIWVKITVKESGIYKISYTDMVDMGFESPKAIQIYGMSGKELSLINSEELPSTLQEIPVKVVQSSSSEFKAGDYVLFYADGTDSWQYDSTNATYRYSPHAYSRYNYYYITSGRSSFKQINNAPQITENINRTTHSYDYLEAYYESSFSPLKSGRMKFETISNKTFTFANPFILSNLPATITTKVAGRHTSEAKFYTYINSTLTGTITIPSATTDNPYAILKTQQSSMQYANTTMQVRLQAMFSGVNSRAYLHSSWLHARSKLAIQKSEQLIFRDTSTVHPNAVSTFYIESSSAISVWDITNPILPTEQTINRSDNAYTFTTSTGTLKEFIAFEKDYKKIISYTKVTPRNILADKSADMLIIYNNPEFISYANDIATLHKDLDNFKTLLINQQDIFATFSSGKIDVSAVRNYIRWLHDASNGRLKYVLLFGDGSFDNEACTENSSLVVTFQSNESLSTYSSFVSDDFFGIVQPSHGVNSNDFFVGEATIAIGRFPVNTKAEAAIVTKKTIDYSRSPVNRGEWQNMLCFLADDADANQTFHATDADKLANGILEQHPYFNIEKIYLDAYKQEVRSAGQRYPEVNKAINERMKKGCLIFNYTGHGSETQMAAENVVNASAIQQWKNASRLPLFITASCEIARFDEPSITSLGEHFILQADGGAVALFTTTRVVYAYSNYLLNRNIYTYLFEKDNDGRTTTIGQAFIEAKKITPNDMNQNKRSFTIFGDPALRLAVPEYSIKIDSIAGKAHNNQDTIPSKSIVPIEGKIFNSNLQFDSTYNGVLHIKVYDKFQQVQTIGNDNNDIVSFEVQSNILFQGKATITNGRFKASFTIPQDIYYYAGNGKISLYATNDSVQATGYEFIPINGTNPYAIEDTNGPIITMYLGDTLFLSGNITHETPTLLVHLFDESGINISHAAMGHNITLILDEDYANPIILNDFYHASFDSYQSGKIIYPLSELSEGNHSLRIKVWDTHNNLSESYIEFTVITHSQVKLYDAHVYPNPTRESAHFSFKHNQELLPIEVTIKIYNMQGKLIHKFIKQFDAQGYNETSVYWDGTTSSGQRVEQGIYPYTIEVKNSVGETATASQKIIIVK